MKTQLNRIKTPDLTRSDFGRALAEQFANIDLNFQKIGNLDLNQGAKGSSCVYIVYNLNAIFMYCTTTEAENTKEYSNWNKIREILTNPNQTDLPIVERWKKLETEVESDYKIFNAHTGGSKAEYAQMCSYLLFGSKLVHADKGMVPTDTSLTGVIWKSKKPELLKDIEVKLENGETYTYKACWLRDWYMLGGSSGSANDQASFNERLSIFKTHILNYDPGRISIACSPAMDPTIHSVGEFEPVGSLAYVYVDPRFRNEHTGEIAKSLGAGASAGASILEDASTVVYWEPRDYHSDHSNHLWEGGFVVVNLFPQIYFDGSGFFWSINGNPTKIPVTGVEGAPGKNSQFVVVERVENIIGASPGHPQGDLSLQEGYDPNDPKCPKIGLWTPDAKNQGLVLNSQSGRTAFVENIAGERATNFMTAYSQVPGITTQLVPSDIPESNDMVLKYKMVSAAGWLLGDWPDSSLNNVEVEHCFRIARIVGKDWFYKNEDGCDVTLPYGGKEFRKYDPSFAQYNYGDQDAVVIQDDEQIQALIRSLDGCPCIIVPGPSYGVDRTDTTVWFSTLRALQPASDKNALYHLVAYCGVENQLRMHLDDHSAAGLMMDLDAYSFKVTGDWRNKPRGLMLPIGSAQAWSGDKEDIWGAHFIHSDLGGFTDVLPYMQRDAKKDEIILDEQGNPKISYMYGDQQPISDLNKLPLLIEQMPSDSLDGKGYAYDTAQFMEIARKRFLHVGSVNDYRTLNFVQNFVDEQQAMNAGIPGRKRNTGTDYHGDLGEDRTYIDDKVRDYYGNSGFWGYDGSYSNDINNKRTPWGESWQEGWFLGSELHVDEPITITRYRDLQKRKHLLNVEGDVTIGLHRHVNDTKQRHRHKDGGLLIQSTLSQEYVQRYRTKPDERIESIFEEQFYRGLTLPYADFLFTDEDWKSRMSRSIDRKYTEKNDIQSVDHENESMINRYYGSWRGYWKVPTDDVLDDKDQVEYYESLPSLLAEDMIGARMMIGLDGIAIYDQNDKPDQRWIDMMTNVPDNSLPFHAENTWKQTKFSVDAFGNIQTYGYEVRSNNPNTFWGFHTEWKFVDEKRTVWSNELGSGGSEIMNFLQPLHNRLMFGTSHKYNPISDYSWYWREVNEETYLKDGQRKGKEDYTMVIPDGATKAVKIYDIPAEITDMPNGWMTEIGYADGKSLNDEPNYKVAFNFNQDNFHNFGRGDYLPTIIKVWSDLLYHMGSLTVAGQAVLPVRMAYATNTKEIDYFGRFGAQIEWGLIIGKPGQVEMIGVSGSAGNPDNPTYFTEDLAVPYSASSKLFKEYTQLPEAIYGTTGSGATGVDDADKGIDNANDYTFANGACTTIIDMFNVNSMNPAQCHPGLWVKAGAIIDETMIVGQDLAVNRAATVRGQQRAASFRRHINSLNLNELVSGNTIFDLPHPSYGYVYTDAALMLDRGWSTWRAPRVKFTKKNGNYEPVKMPADVKEAPIYIDMGPGYKSQRLVKFGTVGQISNDQGGNIKIQPTVPRDHQTALYGVMPYASNFVVNRTGYLWNNGSQRFNKIVVNAQSSGLLATINIKIFLDWRARGGHHKNSTGTRHSRNFYFWGINPNANVYGSDVALNDGPGGTSKVQFSGWKWNDILGPDFPKPMCEVDVHIPGIASNNPDSDNYEHNQMVSGCANVGMRMRLKPDGTLWNEWSMGSQFMMYAANQKGGDSIDKATVNRGRYLSVIFTYPIKIDDINEHFRWKVTKKNDPSAPGQVYETNDEPTGVPSATWPFLWKATYYGPEVERPTSGYGPYELYDVYKKDPVEIIIASTDKDVDDEGLDEPIGIKNLTQEQQDNVRKWLEDPQTYQGDLDRLLQQVGATILWSQTTTYVLQDDTGEMDEVISYVLLYEKALMTSVMPSLKVRGKMDSKFGGGLYRKLHTYIWSVYRNKIMEIINDPKQQDRLHFAPGGSIQVTPDEVDGYASYFIIVNFCCCFTATKRNDKSCIGPHAYWIGVRKSGDDLIITSRVRTNMSIHRDDDEIDIAGGTGHNPDFVDIGGYYEPSPEMLDKGQKV